MNIVKVATQKIKLNAKLAMKVIICQVMTQIKQNVKLATALKVIVLNVVEQKILLIAQNVIIISFYTIINAIQNAKLEKMNIVKVAIQNFSINVELAMMDFICLKMI
jgi:hypothetical protein